MDTYPRKPGTATFVRATECPSESRFGHCPACGSTGRETSPDPGSRIIEFICSDELCHVISRDEATGRETLWRTEWFQEKLPELIAWEKAGIFWNDLVRDGKITPPN
ncbi:hypothetical protein C4587_01130 [Candidatus Parcubacteria bacterium]|nr:MAG: hypothetical protein C4587_01130 [Candidatus Parcubacteria bacterium]